MKNNSLMPSPIILLGDHYLCNKNIVAAKKKYKEYDWIDISASTDSPDKIRSISTEIPFLSNPKILLIKDLPNKKAIREFLIDLIKTSKSDTRFIIWDSEEAIKVDPKTKTFNKTWSEFLEEFKQFKDHKIINNGSRFSEKEDGDCVSFVIENFSKYKRTISRDVAQVFMQLVGKERSYIVSEIEKLCIIAPQTITVEFINDSVYPSSKEAILYKFSNALDSNYNEAIIALDQFLDLNINANVLAEIMMKKARWQLATAYFYHLGVGLDDIPRRLMQMGKFPSVAWHSDKLTYDQKKNGSSEYDSTIKIQDFMSRKLGLPIDYFGESKEKTRAEVIPMDFMAIQIVNSMAKNVIRPALSALPIDKVRHMTYDKYLFNYLFISEKLKQIRYGNNPIQDLYEMIVIFTDKTLKEKEPKQEDIFEKMEV